MAPAEWERPARNWLRWCSDLALNISSVLTLQASLVLAVAAVVKLVPVAGAVVGYTVDRSYARALGESAIRYYSGR